MAAHAPGDGDEVPADADKGYPHHHASCHEHHVNTPIVENTRIRGEYSSGFGEPDIGYFALRRNRWIEPASSKEPRKSWPI